MTGTSDDRESWEVGWHIFKQSFGVLRNHPRLAVFPLVSSLGSLVAIYYTFFFLMIPISNTVWEYGGTLPFVGEIGVKLLTVYIDLAVAILLASFIISFCNVALIRCTRDVIDGDRPSVFGGIKTAISNIVPVFLYATTTAIMGFAVVLAEREGSLITKIVVYLLGASYTVLTFFALPSAVLGSENAVTMYTRSASIVRQRFGDVTRLSLGVLGVAYMVASIILLLLFIPVFAVVITRAQIFGWIIAFMTQTPEGLVVSYSLISLAIMTFIVGLNFTAMVKTVLYVDTVEESRTDIFDETIGYVDELNSDDADPEPDTDSRIREYRSA
ncbi:MAG: DUF6159 family protein [Halobacteria archaeon]|nr:DUF6159 family protein [Halobacteria archaeon]